ncbi:neuroligin-4, Y-linked [Caerostris extrusa]|uniref:Neuroligin-4, Y-linked n=1 Tax=Caerostris extrusa TaxID=172846 RepID=A0AAV4QP67_CAEEX|nr:neuroligin-4, Y-linked [Caerostris extrusa]
MIRRHSVLVSLIPLWFFARFHKQFVLSRQLQPTEVFLGVPYAGAPKARLRFMPPVTSPHWKGVRLSDHLVLFVHRSLPDISNETEALKKDAARRYQYLRRLLPYLSNQSEDCLYLNIYAPQSGK